jgi:hypothetical protein
MVKLNKDGMFAEVPDNEDVGVFTTDMIVVPESRCAPLARDAQLFFTLLEKSTGTLSSASHITAGILAGFVPHRLLDALLTTVVGSACNLPSPPLLTNSVHSTCRPHLVCTFGMTKLL